MSANSQTLVGFGFGPIQAGLFLYEAFRTGRFERLVVAEVMPDLVDALRRAGGAYDVNVAEADGVTTHRVSGIAVLNPRVPEDRARLVAAVADAQELVTALPSVAVFDGADDTCVASVLADGLRRKSACGGPRAVLYAAENHNHAAERLAEALRRRAAPMDGLACLNTVIGKMSGVVTDAETLQGLQLAPFVPGASRAFLVEAFNRILVSRVPWPGFRRGLDMFVEKDDLLPFEEAKLYGHNAVHALLGYHLWGRGARHLSDAARIPELRTLARDAFLQESGAALCRKHAGVDPLFTTDGFRAYADDLLVRMLNPHLRDAVDRVTRDPQRKLGWNDRLVGTMRLALSCGIRPHRFAGGANLALRMLDEAADARARAARLRALWAAEAPVPAEMDAVIARIEEARHED